MTWQFNGVNYFLDRPEGGFFLSYNPGVVPDIFGVCNEETAICIIDKHEFLGRRFYILNGDWRDKMAAAINHGGLYEAIRLYRDNPHYWAPTTDQIVEDDLGEERP